MGTRFSGYLHEQPEMLERALSRPMKDMEEVLSFCGGELTGLVMIGSGSSYHAACAAAPFMRRLLNTEVECLTPSMAMALPALPAGLVLAVSQTGTSTSTLEIVARCKADGRPVICVTAMPQSPVAREADIVLDVLCGEEQVGPKTKGVTATLLALLTFSLALSKAHRMCPDEELQSFSEALQAIPDRMREAVEMGEAFFQQHEERLRSLEHIVFIAGAGRMGACAECALKLMETCRLPSFYYELEEFMHGVHYTIGEESAFFFLPDAAVEDRMLRLQEFSLQKGAQVFWAELPWQEDVAETFGLMGFFHGVCAGLSQARGIDCDIARYPEFGGYMATKTN